MLKRIYDPDNTLDILIGGMEIDKLSGRIPAETTEADMEALNDEITRVMEVNANAVCALLPQDDYPGAAALHIFVDTVIGGKHFRCICELTNVGEAYPNSIINAIPMIDSIG